MYHRNFPPSLWLATAFVLACGCRPQATPSAPASSASTQVSITPSTPQAEQGPVWFTDVTAQTGIRFRHVSGASEERPFPAANGSGIAVADYDRDGRQDLYFLTGTHFPFDPQSRNFVNRLYRNLGDWHFADVTATSGADHNGFSAGAAVGDYDGDGFADIHVTCYGQDCLLHNQGDGTFLRLDQVAGLDNDRWGSSAAFFDADGDGGLDLYVCNYAKWTLETNQFCGDRVRNIRLYCSPNSVEPEPDLFFHNQGDGTFIRATEAAGLVGRPGRAQGIVAADLNDDGWVDVYVANDLNPNTLFLGRGDGTFEDTSEASGAAYDYLGSRQAGMGVDVGDVDGDGRLEIFVTNYQGEHNTLYQNLGRGLFQDVSFRQGLAADSMPWICWGTAFTDFNLDGWIDLIVTSGHIDDNRHLLGEDAPYQQPPLLHRNKGRGKFELVGAEAGGYFRERHVGRALVIADLDHDGDEDVVIGHRDGPPALLRCEAISPQRTDLGSCSLRLVGTRGNRDAIGSLVTLVDGQPPQKKAVKGGGSYQSASDLQLVFGVEANATELAFEIRWPSREISRVAGLQPGRRYVVWEPRAPSAEPHIEMLP